MSVGQFFRMMLGVALCLVMLLPSVMHSAMAEESGMVSLSEHAAMARHEHAVFPMREGGAMPMMMPKPPSSMQTDMMGGMAPCCQSHHAACDAGLVPEGWVPEPVTGWKAACLLYETRMSLRSSIVPPWRPPAALPV